MNPSSASLRLCLSLFCAAFGLGVASAERQPNFIIIFTDDQGYEDLGCFGSKQIKSPHLDRMAREGMKLTSFYTASSVCSPSRAGLLTGRMPKRVGVPSVLFPRSQTGLPPEEITIAELLKTKGYATGIVGKWHLGHLPQFLPTNQGFDSYFGLPYSNDMSIAKEIALSDDLKLDPRWTRKRLERDLKVYETDYRSMKDIMPLMRGEEIIEYPTDQSQLTKRYTHEAVRFIERNKEKPFFLYLPHTMPHTPIFVDERFKDSSGVSLYCDSIQEIDWSVGRVLNSLRENNLAEKTLVLFCSDNGPANREDKPGGSSAGPFRGHKFDTFEGGHRVSCIVWAPGLIEEGTESDAITSTLDLFPTIAHLAGIPLPTDRVYDSYNLAPLLTGQTDTSPRKEMFFYRANSTELDGVRIGDWKFLHRGSHRNRDKKPASPMLFHLSTDPGEQTNLAEENPEKVEELLARMKAFDEAITTE